MMDGRIEREVMDGVRETNKGGLNSDVDARVRNHEEVEDSRWWLQTDRQTGRQADRQTGRQADRLTG